MIFKGLKTLFKKTQSNNSSGSSTLNEKGFYVYVHETMSGEVFYVGKGTGRRAWVKGRDIHWNNYVENHLNNEYQVRIVYENLSEEEALNKEAELMAHYGDQLLNRQNMSRQLDIDALNNRNRLIEESEKLALEAELESNLELKSNLFIEALNYHKKSATIVFEKGLFGKLSEERPLGNIRLLDKTIRSLIASEKKEEAMRIFEQYFIDYPQDKELKSVPSILKVIERGTVKLTPQEEFIPPRDLPLGWIYIKKDGERVPRLDSELYHSNSSDSYDIGELKGLVKRDLSEAMSYIKKWIIKEEKTQYKDPYDRKLWLYPEARKIANKQRNPLEECLFQNLYIEELKKLNRNNKYLENLIVLRKLSAKLAKNS